MEGYGKHSGPPILTVAYQPLRHSRSEFHPIRGLRYHVRIWDAAPDRPSPGTLVMLHGWMDVSASFQFLVDSLEANWRVIAPDWRGFGLTDSPQADCYWFPDYIADLDFLLDVLMPDEPVNLVAHSMGGNAATLYTGVRPHRVRRLVNLEGIGMPGNHPSQAPERYSRWIDELKAGTRMRDYASRDEVAQRLRQNNSRLKAEYAAFLAEHWSLPTPDGRFKLAGDPAHKVVNAQLYRVEEIMAAWRKITAPVLLIFASDGDRWRTFNENLDYRRRILAIRTIDTVTVPDAGHMLHHDQPQMIARMIEDFVE